MVHVEKSYIISNHLNVKINAIYAVKFRPDKTIFILLPSIGHGYRLTYVNTFLHWKYCSCIIQIHRSFIRLDFILNQTSSRMHLQWIQGDLLLSISVSSAELLNTFYCFTKKRIMSRGKLYKYNRLNHRWWGRKWRHRAKKW